MCCGKDACSTGTPNTDRRVFIKGWMFSHTRKGWSESLMARATVHLGRDLMTED